MQECLDNNDILMYSTHNRGKSVIAESIIKALKDVYKKWQLMIENLVLVFLNHSINKNLLILIILLWLKQLIRILKLLNMKLKIESELLSILSIKTVLVNIKLEID